MDVIRVKYECTAEEQAQGNDLLLAAQDKKPVKAANKPSVAKGAAGWFMFIGLTVVLYFLLGQKPVAARNTAQPAAPTSTANTIAIIICAVGGCSIPIGLFVLSIRLRIKRQSGNSGDSFECVFDERGVQKNVGGLRYVDYWSSFIGFDEGADAFLLKTSLANGFVIPKRLFKADECDRVRALMQRAIEFPALPLGKGFPMEGA